VINARASLRRRGRRVALLALLTASALLLPAATASAHAYLIRTAPVASGVLDSAPSQVALTFDEAVEPRLAIISVTDAAGRQLAAGPVRRSPADPDTLSVPLRPHLAEGWYLVYWRAISIDGHPVQGAFTYAVGPNPGPAPQFPVPHLSATAVTPALLITRWLVFGLVMSAIGLLALRLLIARPLARERPEASLRPITRAFALTAVLALLAIPVYLDFAIANDSLRSVFDLGALVPLYGVTAFGRGYLDLELCFALFCAAAMVALWLDRPERPRRSVAELAGGVGAALAAAASLLVPSAVGHAGQTSPRGVSLLLDWVHLASGSVWLGGLVGLLVLWFALPARDRAASLAVVVPRFSTVALVSVIVLLLTGTGATIIHMPALNALWQTGYGRAILVKAGLLLAAIGLGAVNLLRSTPRLRASRQRPELGEPASRLLRRTAGGEVLLVGGAVFVAALLSSLPPPPPSFVLQNAAVARVGPGRVAATVSREGYRLQVLVSPNRAAAPDAFALRITRGGAPVTGANVLLTLNHLEMQMPQQEYQLREIGPGLYSRSAPALIMVGKWGLDFQVTPRGAPAFSALIVDQANG
jgi:copper transport protein